MVPKFIILPAQLPFCGSAAVAVGVKFCTTSYAAAIGKIAYGRKKIRGTMSWPCDNSTPSPPKGERKNPKIQWETKQLGTIAENVSTLNHHNKNTTKTRYKLTVRSF